MLVLFALLAVGFLGLAAASADLGVVRATRLTMQATADSAALEGLRLRDAGDPASAEMLRRSAASLRARRLFDEDGDLATANGEFLLGAGPNVLVTPMDAAQPLVRAVTYDDPALYVPRLELNLQNEVEGDLVAGTYLPTVLDPADPLYATALLHLEASDYRRTDFARAPAGAVGAPAFLARLRRSDGPLDAQSGVSSSGAPLPYLFQGPGLGAEPGSGYDPRSDGLTVRATAIAAEGAAIVAGDHGGGPPPLALGLDAGGQSLVVGLDLGTWNCWSSSTAAGDPLTLELDESTGLLTCATPGISCSGSAGAVDLCATFAAALVLAAEPTTTGQRLVAGRAFPVPSPALAAFDPPPVGARYLCAATAALPSGAKVVGLVAVELEALVVDPTGAAHQLTLSRVPDLMLRTDASAIAQPFLGQLTSDPLAYQAHRAVLQPARVPVLAR